MLLSKYCSSNFDEKKNELFDQEEMPSCEYESDFFDEEGMIYSEEDSDVCEERAENIKENKSIIEKIKEEFIARNKGALDNEVAGQASHILETFTEPAVFGTEKDRFRVLRDIFKRFHKNQRKIFKALKTLMPFREELCSLLLMSIFRKLSGSKIVRTPILVGPPGTGKSYAVEALVNALNTHGIITRLHLCKMSSYMDQSKDLTLRLLGSESHYTRSHPGVIFKDVSNKNVDLVVVFIDEVEKGMPVIYPTLVNLLDPNQPLQDMFINSIITHPHDMRFKTVFVLAGNNIEPLLEIPELRDRLESPIEFKPYSPKEKVELVVRLSRIHFSSITCNIDNSKKRKIAWKIMQQNPDISLRELLDQVEKELLSQLYPWYRTTSPVKPASKRRIGFV